MKRAVAALFLLLFMSAARSTSTDAPPYEPPAGWNRPNPHLVVPTVPPPPPPRQPLPAKPLSEVERMTPAQIVQWMGTVAPRSNVRKIEIEGDPGAPTIWLLGDPQFDPRLGVCSLWGWPVNYDVLPAKGRNGDPLIRPTGVGGAMRRRPARTKRGCYADVPYDQWTDAGSAETYAAGFRRLREAIATVGPDGRTRLPIDCVDLVVPASGACKEPGRLLARLRPELASEIGQDLWTYNPGYGGPSPPADSLLVKIRDAQNPGVVYRITIRGMRHPTAVRIKRYAGR